MLGVCAVQERVAFGDKEMELRKVMGLSLTIDHRIVDGGQGALFLSTLTSILESADEHYDDPG